VVALSEAGPSTAWDVAMFDVPDEVSAEWGPIAAAKGVVVVDNSGAFRMDPRRPRWWCPRSNPGAVRKRPKGIISNPNCTTLSMIVAMGARLHAEFGPHRPDRRLLPGRLGGRADRHRHPCATSSPKVAAFPVAGLAARGTCAARSATSARSRPRWRSTWCRGPASLRDGGWSSEELKVRNESRKILGLPNLKVSANLRACTGDHHPLAVRARLLRAGGLGGPGPRDPPPTPPG